MVPDFSLRASSRFSREQIIPVFLSFAKAIAASTFGSIEPALK